MVLVFGTICIDRLRQVDRLPAPGGYVEIRSERVLLGGEAANTANALTTWGHPALLTGNALGNDAEAETLRGLMEAKRLPYQPLPVSANEKRVAPVCDIYITPDGERTMFGRGFASSGEGLDLAALPLAAGEWFTAEPNMEVESRDAVRRAMEAGMKVYVMDFIRPDDPIQSGGFWQSSTDWAGFRGNAQRNVQWVKEFVSAKGCFAILSDGPNGFVAGGAGQPVRVYPPFPAPEVVDTTGAGDLFRAGMLHGLDSGWELPRCLTFASAAGCLKCRSLGATSVVPTIEEIEAHIAANPDVADRYGR